MEAKVETIQTVVEEEKKEVTKAEICFGALMAVAAICGLWGVTSILIQLFLGV